MTTLDQRRVAPPQEVDEELEPLVAEMRGYRATYFSVIDKARAQKSLDEEVARRALDAFDKLEVEFFAATTDEARKNIVERSEEIEQTRAYIQPESEIAVEAKTLVADMTDWGVPESVLKGIDRDLMRVIDPPAGTLSTPNQKRSALNKLYAFYDAWSDHVANYERWATRTAWVLGVLLIIAAVCCLKTIVSRQPVHGFMLAGLMGALLSVLGKFPPMLGWGQWASYTPRMIGRITTGIATTLAGGALLTLDVIQIGSMKFEDLFTHPSTKGMLLLIGLGIVFGFTERALVQFQEIVFKPEKEPKVGTK